MTVNGHAGTTPFLGAMGGDSTLGGNGRRGVGATGEAPRIGRSPLPGNNLFSTLSAREYVDLVAAAQRRGVVAGGVLTHQGEPVASVYFVQEGRARAELSSGQKGEPLAIVNLLGPGDDIGLLSIVDGAPHSATIRAMTALEVMEVPLGVMRGLLGSHSEWYAMLARLAVARLRTSGVWLEKLL